MRRTICRAAVVAIVASSALAVVASPALASIPSGEGWSGSWEYTSATALTVSETIPGAVLTATGTDTGTSRTFTVVLTDTSTTDGECASVTWGDGALTTSNATCGPEPLQFVPASQDADVSITLCLQPPEGNSFSHCNILNIPNSNTEPYIRTPYWGFSWAYVNQQVDPEPNSWSASMVMGEDGFNTIGTDNYRGGGDRLLEPYLFGNLSPLCESGQILNGSPVSSASTCTSAFVYLPNTIDTSASGTTVVGCVWSQRVVPTRKHCLTGVIPLPN